MWSMFRKDAIKCCRVVLCVMAITILFAYTWNKNENVDWKEKYMELWSNRNFSKVENMVKTQRNNLSKLLNKKQQIIGRMKCEELNRSKVAKAAVTDVGGYCPIASRTKHSGFDKKLAITLAKFFEGNYIASFGDGPGKFKEAVLETGLVRAYDAYDGAPFCEVTSNGLVQFLDLSIPQFGLPVYDWILCLEVAEHVPKAFEEVLLGNLVRHARKGVILSWARPDQPGYSHVNNRSPEYVISCMHKLDFEIHREFTNQIRNGTTIYYLKSNLNVFVRKVKQSADELSYNA